MRLYRNAIILIVVLGLLIGALVIVKNKKGSDDTSAESSTEEIKVVKLEKDKITEVTLENPNGKFVFTKKDKDFIVSIPADIKADISKADLIVTNISSINALKLVEEKASDLKQYGFDGVASATMKTSDGKTITLELGAKTLSGEGYYLKEKGSSKVYVIEAYTAEKILSSKNDLKDTKVYSGKPEDVNTFTLERKNSIAFSAKKSGDSKWVMTQPFEADADIGKIAPLVDAVTQLNINDFVEDKAADLVKYGLDKPNYAIEMGTASGKVRILIGLELEKGSTAFAKLADSSDVFTMGIAGLEFLDKPAKDILQVFTHIIDIKDVNKVAVTMDGKTVNCEIKDESKEKFVVDGKEVPEKDKTDGSPFRRYYQALVGVRFSDLDTAAKPSGKPEITLDFDLKKAPGAVKMEFIPKDDKNYYVMKNGKYTNMVVEKKMFDEPGGIRDSYKLMMEAISGK
ncbi:MAG: DUF4340 domain-containing protein [Clostridia bacterium]|nr:DUF4340 domain-containing protein [Clostridia bacterium]